MTALGRRTNNSRISASVLHPLLCCAWVIIGLACGGSPLGDSSAHDGTPQRATTAKATADAAGSRTPNEVSPQSTSPSARPTAERLEPPTSRTAPAHASPAPPPDDITAVPAAASQQLDRIVKASLRRGDAPGAVVVVLRGGQPVLQRAYGYRQVVPKKQPMTLDTVFDAASLTKPVVTASLIMRFAERGQLSLNDRVAKHLSEFRVKDKRTITIAQLMAHTSGLPAANALSHFADRTRLLSRIAAQPLRQPPGRSRHYSDVGYIVLGEMLSRIAKQPLEQLARVHIFDPLGMQDSGFLPNPRLHSRCAPTEKANAADVSWLHCQVHDPRAARLNGVAGHAGLFTTAADLTRYAQTMLAAGRAGGRSWLSPKSVARLTAGTPPNSRHRLAFLRTFDGGYRHTGFTGTSLWLHAARGDGIILLTSRLHPDGKGNVIKLRRALRGWMNSLFAAQQPTALNGIDAFIAGGHTLLSGKRIGLITHDAARAADGRRTADVLFAAPTVNLTKLFSPEHGLGVNHDGAVSDTHDVRTGLPVHSLYGTTPRLQPQQLRNLDMLVFDLQDAGARFYTYLTTLGYALEAAAQYRLPLVVLDRPNPIGGHRVEGPMLDAQRTSFVAYHRLPVRHGMTFGELAKLLNAERAIGAQLHIVKARHWKRSDTFARTGQVWRPPSPNLRSPQAALLYPGLALLEMTNVSVGRGSDSPFLQIGAPWMQAAELHAALQGENLVGVRSEVVSFTPSASKYAGKRCHGLRFVIIDPQAFRSVHLGLTLAHHLRRLHPRTFAIAKMLTLLGNADAMQALLAGKTATEVEALGRNELDTFKQLRTKFLLYRSFPF